jgi:hypothetical protein
LKQKNVAAPRLVLVAPKVGVDNRPGDIVIKASGNGVLGMPLLVVIETRDRQNAVGRKVIADTLGKAMAERKASAAVYLSKTAAGFAGEIGEWADGTTDSGPFVACTHENLLIALRWLVIQKRLSQTRDQSVEIDAHAIQQHAQRVRTSLDRVKTINRKVTDVRASANEIQTEAETLRDEIRMSLTAIEDALKSRTVTTVKRPVPSVVNG